MKLALTIVAVTVTFAVPAIAQNQCYRDAAGNVRCTDGTTIYNQGNGLYGDRSGNRMQIIQDPDVQRPSGNPYYDQLMDNRSRQCRDFPSLCR